MNAKRVALATVIALLLAGCGATTDPGSPDDPDAPLLQITTIGGFVPVEHALGQGPRYTLLSDGRLIYEGPTIMIFPGPLVPNYQVTRIDEEQMRLVLDLVDEIGLPEMGHESDDTASSRVADASTEVVTYWDANGEHSYSVYALGIDMDVTPPPATEAFASLYSLMGDLSSGEAVPYEPERVRIVAGPGFVNEEFEDVRQWPLPEEDPTDWETLPNEWLCKTFGPDVLEAFADATQVTVWEGSGLPYTPTKLLVRPLHPGEPDCPR